MRPLLLEISDATGTGLVVVFIIAPIILICLATLLLVVLEKVFRKIIGRNQDK
jgi:hypothetical protein